MVAKLPFEVQGHRGARGLRPENTLPSFEAALDAGVSTIETDVHLTADGVPVLIHDALLTARLCRSRPRFLVPAELCDEPLVSSMTLAEVRCFVADRNPDRRRFPDQKAVIAPLAGMWARKHLVPSYMVPTLADLFAFTVAYAGDEGARAGKSPAQRARAQHTRFDLELKRVPFHPEAIGDTFQGARPGLLEEKVVGLVRDRGLAQRTCVRSFDHRAVRAAKKLAPEIAAAVLIADTAVIAPGDLARAAKADTYAPDYRFVDPELIRLAHHQGVRVVPWTVNEPHDWEKLITWGVDGLCTDYPDRLMHWLVKRRIPIM